MRSGISVCPQRTLDDKSLFKISILSFAGSGAIEIGDFIETFNQSKKSQGLYESRLQETFEMMDLDGNGYLSRNEVKQCIMVNCNDTPEEIINNLIDDADMNEDGQISYTGKEKTHLRHTTPFETTVNCNDTLEEIINNLIDDADMNEDGQISYMGKEKRSYNTLPVQ